MLPLVSHGANLSNLCPFPDSSALYVQNWFPIRPAVWPQFPSLLNCWSHKSTHNAALGYRGANCLSRCPFPDESTDVYHIWCQSVQPFDSFPSRMNVWHPNPPPPSRHAPLGIEGWLVLSLCPFPDESADVNQRWCQSVQPFDSFPNFWMCDPLTPDMPPGVLRGDLYLAYAHSQMNPQTWTKVGANRSSCLTASPDFCWMFDPLTPPPKCSLVSLRAICLAYIHSQMNLHMCTKFEANRTSRLTSSPDFWIGDPLTPSPNVEGRIVFSLCPFPDESADVYQMWCQSVQPFASFPRLLNVWPPKPPPPDMPPWVLKGDLYLAYENSQMNPQTWLGPAVWQRPLTFLCLTP